MEKARFDTTLPKEQKEFFEYAARLGGFKTLSEFVITSAKEKAKKIVDDYNDILISERDKKIFFDTLISKIEPCKNLEKALARYNKALEE